MPLPVAAVGAAKIVGGFIVQNWKALVVLVLLAIAGWKIWSVWDENKDLKKDVATLTTKNKELTDDNTQMADILETSKDAAEKIKELSDRIDGDFSKLNDRIATQQRAIDEKLDQMRREPAPRTNEESVNEIVRNAAELRSDDK